MTIHQAKKTILILIATLSQVVCGCYTLDPVKEETPELITRVTLTFTPMGVPGPSVVVTATDPDGEGVKNIAADGPINLSFGITYVLDIQLINGLVPPGTPGYDLTEEVVIEGDEHQMFFSWTDLILFSDPVGEGNIDVAGGPVNYTGGANALDRNGRPLGLTTTWSTVSAGTASGSFRVVLKHQPDAKSDSSDVMVGETDLDLTFAINVQ